VLRGPTPCPTDLGARPLLRIIPRLCMSTTFIREENRPRRDVSDRIFFQSSTIPQIVGSDWWNGYELHFFRQIHASRRHVDVFIRDPRLPGVFGFDSHANSFVIGTEDSWSHSKSIHVLIIFCNRYCKTNKQNLPQTCVKVPAFAPPWVGSRSPDGWDQIPRWAGGWVLHQPAPWSFGFDSQTRGTRENRRTLY
jgi:hypothetical protein